jgi:hypothetical protein
MLDAFQHPGDKYTYFRSGYLEPICIITEDHIGSIEMHIKYLCDQKANVIVTHDPDVSLEMFKTHGNNAAYFFDYKMDNLPPKIFNRRTHGGIAAGPALISAITDDGEGSNITHCAGLSDFIDSEEAANTIGLLRERGQLVSEMTKLEDEFYKFKNFYKVYIKEFNNLIRPRMINNDIAAISRAFSEIHECADFTKIEPLIFGYAGSSSLLWPDAKGSPLVVAAQDIRERIEILSYIKEGLVAAFDIEGTSEQKMWMYLPDERLKGLSPWAAIETGNKEELRRVASLVNIVLG